MKQIIIRKLSILIMIIKKSIFVLFHDGFKVFFQKSKYFLSDRKDPNFKYKKWISNSEKDIRKRSKLNYNPLISIVVPVYNVKSKHLRQCIESVREQTYKNWELCIADDASTWKNVKKVLKSYEKYSNIKITYRKKNGHISRATNSAIKLAAGEYIAFLDCDDTLSPNALYEMAKKLNENPDYDFIYSDEDKINDNGKNRHMPHFKPDWSPDTFMSHMYTCHLSMYRKDIVLQIGGMRVGYEGAQDYDFVLRFTEKTKRIGHIPKILYHWRERKESTSGNLGAKPYILNAVKKAKEDALIRRKWKGTLELIEPISQWRVNYINEQRPLVSIIILSKDNFEIYNRCIKSLINFTDYKNFEIITIDNGSTEENRIKYEKLNKDYRLQYYYKPQEFNFSKLCNLGADLSNGEYLLFLNDDTEIQQKDWLNRMIGHASLEHIGAVGAKLLYPNSHIIQHIGILNIKLGPVHSFIGYDDQLIYYFGRNRLEYNYIAVTGACLLVNKEKFFLINKFNEKLPVAYNDVDLCMRLIEAGYYNVVRNDVIFYHYESISRGSDIINEEKKERLIKEQKYLYCCHPNFVFKDPFYNLNLTQNKVDCSI